MTFGFLEYPPVGASTRREGLVKKVERHVSDCSRSYTYTVRFGRFTPVYNTESTGALYRFRRQTGLERTTADQTTLFGVASGPAFDGDRFEFRSARLRPTTTPPFRGFTLGNRNDNTRHFFGFKIICTRIASARRRSVTVPCCTLVHKFCDAPTETNAKTNGE